MPRTFELVRHRDLSGVSGTGVVAEGCVFTDGSVALRWRGNNPATAVWPDLESVLAVHGHHGATEVHWLEGWTEPSPPPAPPELRGRPPLGERGARPLHDFHPSPASTPANGTTREGAGTSKPPPGSNTAYEALDTVPSESGRTIPDATHSSLDGPTLLPRLAGLDYAAPTSDSLASGVLEDGSGSSGFLRGTTAGGTESGYTGLPVNGHSSRGLSGLDHAAPLGDEAASRVAPAPNDRAALGDGGLGDGGLGERAAFGGRTAAGGPDGAAGGNEDGRPAFDEHGRPAFDADDRAALDEHGRPAFDTDGRPAFDADGRGALDDGDPSALEYDGRSALDEGDRGVLDELFGVQHAVLPPSGPVEPSPGGRVRGWAGARHRR